MMKQFSFIFLYSTLLINTMVQSFYQRSLMEEQYQQLDFQLIITILQVICPVFGGIRFQNIIIKNKGFVIDHVQYTLNLLLMGMMLSLLSYIYFTAYCFAPSVPIQYLYFAIGFHALALQLQQIITLALVVKAFKKSDIPQQMSYQYAFNIGGRFISFILLLPIYLNDKNPISSSTLKLCTKSNLYQTYVILLGILLLCCTICIWKIFPHIRTISYSMNTKLRTLQLDDQMGLLLSLKRLLNTSRAVVALSAATIIGIINIWLEYQYTFIGYYFNSESQSNGQYQVYGGLAQELPYSIGIIISPIVGLYLKKSKRYLQILSYSTSLSLLCFFMLTLVMLHQESIIMLRIFIYILMLIGLQVALTLSVISSTTLIGYDFENYQSHGFSYGLFYMLINLFQVWVLSVLIAEIRAKQIRNIYQITIICFFALCFSLVGFIIVKVLTFVQQQKLSVEYKFIHVQNDQQHRPSSNDS